MTNKAIATLIYLISFPFLTAWLLTAWLFIPAVVASIIVFFHLGSKNWFDKGPEA